MAGSAPEDDEITGINVTPLVDVVLVLLIIFMVTADFLTRESVDVDLPHASHTGQTAQGPLHIAVDKTGALFLDGQGISEAALREKVKALAASPDARAIVSADQALPYGQVVHLLDLVRGEGISKFALSIEKNVQPGG
jgi:biopolymer transport protein TolR